MKRPPSARYVAELAASPLVSRVFASARPFDPTGALQFSHDFELLFLDPAFPRRPAWERIAAPARTGKSVARIFRELANQGREGILLLESLQPVLVGPLRVDADIETFCVDWCICDPSLRWAFICSHEARMFGQSFVEAYDPDVELGRESSR